MILSPLLALVRDIDPATGILDIVAQTMPDTGWFARHFVYGKKQTKLVPMIAGGLLCIYPYFIDSLLWLCIVGGILIIAPFFIDG